MSSGTIVQPEEKINHLIAALRSCENRFRDVISRNADAVVIIDAGGIVRFANPAAAELFCCRAEELVGSPFGFPLTAGESTEIHIVCPPPFTQDAAAPQTFIAEMRVVDTEWENKPAFLASLRNVTDRKRAEESIERLNTELAHRAAALEAANLELETFSYTVSHDLRTPLNNISAYSQVLLNLCAEGPGGAGHEYLIGIEREVQRMDKLIGALLQFSRATFTELNKTKADLSAMALTVTMGLKMADPQRTVTCTIPAGITAEGDPVLLRVVLENLFANAWKYTGNREHAEIEFGTTSYNGATAYFVRDNGAGFDMSQSDQLFQAFQRLHTPQEFAGHGIGLATVQRIIQRHGGRIWAEGEPDRGATFYFTLP